MLRMPNDLGWFCRGKDISDLMHRAIRGQILCPDPDVVLNIESHLFNCVLQSESCEYDLDVGKQVWLNIGRWSRLCKEYVPLEPLNRFVDQCAEIVTGQARHGATANMFFRDPDRYAKKHRWGGCLMGATFRGDGHNAGKPCLTFYSRTTYIGYMGLLDAAIAHCTAREIVRRALRHWKGDGPLALDCISFRWHISSCQLHCFKTLPYIYSQPDLMQRLERVVRNPRTISKHRLSPTWYHLAKWFHKVVDGYEKRGSLSVEDWLLTEKYGPFRRIKRRWCEAKGYLKKHVPPSLPVSTLTFEKCI
jgi:hypothetical protein